MKDLNEAEFTIVGTGLMGASLALALKDKVKTRRGVDSNAVNLATAAPLFDEVTDDLATGVAQSDVVVLATPIRTILHLIEKLKPILKPGTLLLDLGSTKR